MNSYKLLLSDWQTSMRFHTADSFFVCKCSTLTPKCDLVIPILVTFVSHEQFPSVLLEQLKEQYQLY